MSDSAFEVIHNTENLQFEIDGEVDKATLVYRFRDKTMFFLHTKVPDSMARQGIGKSLVITALNFADSKNTKIAVLCPFTAAYVAKNPEWYRLYDEEFHRIPASARQYRKD